MDYLTTQPEMMEATWDQTNYTHTDTQRHTTHTHTNTHTHPNIHTPSHTSTPLRKTDIYKKKTCFKENQYFLCPLHFFSTKSKGNHQLLKTKDI